VAVTVEGYGNVETLDETRVAPYFHKIKKREKLINIPT
jgi:hypothetical protein